jgi:hypothetical protein
MYSPSFGPPSDSFSCFNGTDWNQIDSGFRGYVLYEEAMWWDIHEPQTTPAQGTTYPFQNLTSSILTLLTLLTYFFTRR